MTITILPILIIVTVHPTSSLVLLRIQFVLRHFVAHGEVPVPFGRSPKVRYRGEAGEVEQAEPAVEEEPACLPCVGGEVFLQSVREGDGRDDEEGEDDDGRADQDPV